MIAPVLVLAALMGQSPDVPVLTLEQALQEAQEKNPDLQVAQAKLQSAQLSSRKAWAGYLPTITAGASYTRNNAEAKLTLPTGYYLRDVGPNDRNGGAFDPTKTIGLDNPPGTPSNTIMMPSGTADMTIQQYNQFGAQLQLQQALVVPALWSGIQATYLGEKLAELNVENGRRELLFAVAQLYYGAATLREMIDVQKRLLATSQEHERDARVRFEAGTIPKIQLVRSQIDTARAEQDVRRAENSYASAKVSLATLLDRPDARFEVERPAAPMMPEIDREKMIEQATKDRLDVQAAQTAVELAEESKRGTRFKYLPNLFLTGAYRYSNVKGFTGEATSWNVGLAASWTLWDGGSREVELKETDAKLLEAKASQRGAALKARDEVLRAILDLESAQANRVKSEEQVKLARENTQMINVNFNAGVATQIEVSDATAQLANAELAAVAESLNAQLAALRLAKAAGAFDPPRGAAK